MENKKNYRNKEIKKEENKKFDKNSNKLQNKKEISSQSYDEQHKDNSLVVSKKKKICLTKEKTKDKEKDINNNHTAEKNLKSLKLQEKLKKIFLEKEKAKYKYNKQIIPEKLKYNSDDEELNCTAVKQESTKNEKLKKAETNPNMFNKNKNKIIYTNVINNDAQKNFDTKKNKIEDDIKNTNINYNTINNITENREKNIKNENNDNNRDFNTINTKNNNNEIEDNRQKYYKLLNLKTRANDKKDENSKKIKKDNNNRQNGLFNDKNNSNKDSEKENETKEKNTNTNIVNKNKREKEKEREREKNISQTLSISVEKINNHNKKESKDLDKINAKKIKSNREIITVDRNDNKKNVLKLLELIKNKKSEREIIDQKKDEIIKRSKSQAIDRKKEEKNKFTNKEINNEIKVEKKDFLKDKDNDKETKNNNNKKTNEIKSSIIQNQKIYKKNPTIRKINKSFKSNNYLSESNNKLVEKIERTDNQMSLSPLNLTIVKRNNFSTSNNKTNRFIFNNRLHNINKNKREYANQINKTENSIQNTFNQSINYSNEQNKKYHKPKISNNNNINNKYFCIKRMNNSLSKMNNLNEYEVNKKEKYNESIVYSPKRKDLKKMKSENSFPHIKRKNKLVENNSNLFHKKNSLINENRDLSKSNYNIYGNFPNIHNYYNNSKIFLKNKFISINPSFSIHNNVSINNNNNNNNIDEIEINSNERNKSLNKNGNNNGRDIIIRNQKSKVYKNKLWNGGKNMLNQGKYVYQKNKITKNKLKEKIFNDSDTLDDKKEDINYEYLRLGTDNMTYNDKTLKNTYFSLADSNIYADNNTFYNPNDNNTFVIDKFNQIYKSNNYNDNNDNIFLSQSSPFYQRKIKKLNVNVMNTLNDTNKYKRSHRISKNSSIFINIENVLIFEEKFNNIISYLKNNLSTIKPCLDFLNYYYNSWIYEKLEKVFKEKEDIEIAKIFLNYLLLTIIICYYFSLKKDIIKNSNYLLLELLEINYNSIMMIFQQIKDNVFTDNQENVFFPILIRIYNKYQNNTVYIENNDSIIKNIYENSEKIDLKVKNLLTIKKNEFFLSLSNFISNLKQKNYKEIKEFFIENVLVEETINGSLFSSNFYINNDIFLDSINPPFLKSPNKKKLTLILDLNDTLINFKYEENGEGYVRIRPFLFGFLEEIGQLYELIVFTSSEKEYADSVIEAIEHERTYFDYVFYRQHTIIVGNDFVKDLTRIGRPLNSTIIIDNMPQNFKLQKENGILIKPFWGEDSNDKTLYDLMPILLDIAKDGGDVRYALNKYKNEIAGKISSNILKNSFI